MATKKWTSGRDRLTGTDHDDVIDGLAGDDVIKGRGGNDRLDGGVGHDVLKGGAGHDHMIGGDGHDFLDGGNGNDRLDGGSGCDVLVGGAGNDDLSGGSDSDVLFGGAGNDSLDGGTGDDWLAGGSGDDVLTGGSGDDALVGGAGRDRAIYSGSVFDYELSAVGPLLTVRDRNTADGDDGNDLLLGVEELRFADFTGAVTDNSQGTSGNDLFVGDSGNDAFDGKGGDDVIFGNGGKDTLKGGAGNDLLSGGHGNDTLDGGAGDDTFLYRSGDGADAVTGGTGVDVFRFVGDTDHTTLEITASAASPYISFRADGLVTQITGVEDLDIALDERAAGSTVTISGDFAGTGLAQDTIHIRGTGGDDRIDASGSRSTERMVVDARGGNDIVRGGRGNDDIDGGVGNDTLDGGPGNDSIRGGIGNDTISGGAGNDTLAGGAGNDSLTGGAGNDTYVVGEGGTDTIADYAAGDVIDIRAPGFTTFASIIAAAQQVGANTVITFGAGNTLTLTGVPRASLTPQSFGLPADSAASAPTLTVQAARGNEDTAIPLVIAAALTDADGSESLAIRIENVPAGAALSAGANQGNGVWLLAPAQLVGLTLSPAPNADADFTLTVRAISTESNGGATATTTQTLAVTVDAINDAPVITSNGGGATAAIALAENPAAVTTVAASDVDAGTALTYSIAGGADAARFVIDAATGALSFASAPSFESPSDSDANNSYVVQVRASDGALADLWDPLESTCRHASLSIL